MRNTTKRILSAAVLLAASVAFAGKVTIGDYTWQYYNSSATTVTIVSVSPLTGTMEIPKFFLASGVTNTVTAIGDTAFEDGRMRSVTIPDSVIEIGEEAFKNCSALTGIAIPNSVTRLGENAFAGCTGLKNVTIPQCVCTDGLWNAFEADKLVKVIVANGVTEIGDYAFSGCYNLTSVTLPSSLECIGDYAFEFCTALTRVKIPNNVGTLGVGIFQDCFALESVTLPSGITKITSSLFSGCFNLTSVNIPSTVCEIYDYAFEECYALSTLKIPPGVSTIGDYAFADSGLATLTLPDSIEEVGEGAFSGCLDLAAVTITQSILDAGVATIFDTDLAAAIIIADGVKEIPASAFEGFAYITGVSLPDTVRSIRNRAFYGCSSLESINLPETVYDEVNGEIRGVREIGAEAFANCTSLVAAEIPEGLESIGDRAFANCYSLTDVSLSGCLFENRQWRGSEYSSSGLQYVFELDNQERSRTWENVTVQYGVQTVSGFGDCPNLRTVVLPASVVSIEGGAFYNCAKLESVTIAEEVDWENPESTSGREGYIGCDAFKGCVSLAEVDIPVWVTSIMGGAFEGCRSLASVELTGSDGRALTVGVTWIGERAFYGCSSLASINLPQTGTYVSSEYNHDSGQWEPVTRAAGVRDIGYEAFCGCSALLSAELPEGLETVGDRAFANCYSLKDVSLSGCLFENRQWRGSEYSSSGLQYVFELDNQERSRTWENVTVQYGVQTVSGFGDCPNLRTVVLPASVVSIEGGAFYNCAKLESVTIAEEVDWENPESTSGREGYIGCDAFKGCVSLAEVDIPVWVTSIMGGAFEGCRSLASVEFPELTTGSDGRALTVGVTWIGERAFYGCSSLASINLPQTGTYVSSEYNHDSGYWEPVTRAAGVRDIGYEAFCGCSALLSAELPEELETVGDRAFANCYSLKDVSLPECVFNSTFTRSGEGSVGGIAAVFELDNQERSRAWENVVIGDGVDCVPSSAFEGLPNLKRVTLPSTVECISDRAFKNCRKLESVTIEGYSQGNGYCDYMIGYEAFYGCTSLKYVDFPENLETINNWAFYGCSSLLDVAIPDTVTFIGVNAFDGCVGLSSMEIPESVMSVVCQAFRNCYGLRDVTLPKSVFDVGVWEVFRIDQPESYPCAWETVTVGEGVTNIAASTFAGLTKLTRVTLPSSVTGIGSEAFAGCGKLTDLVCEGNAPTAVEVDAFTGVKSSCTVWVNKGSTGWGTVPGTWQGMKTAYLSSSSTLPALSCSANMVATQASNGWTVQSASGSALTKKDLASLKVAVTMNDEEVDTTAGYDVTLSDDGKSAVLTLKTPEVATAAEVEEEKDEDDPSGMLVAVDESAIDAKPTPQAGECVGALPAKTVKGLWYQASWGSDLNALTQGAKVQATGESIYLGVIKQTGSCGFYRISVSEK